MHGRHGVMETHREGDWNEEKGCVSVSYQQRPCSPLPGFSSFLTLFLLGALYQPKVSVFDNVGMRLNNQLSFRQILRILPLSLIL